MEITEFLLARIAEDEAVAQMAMQGVWYWEPESDDKWPSEDQSLMCHSDPDAEFDDSVLAGWGYDASGIEGRSEDRAHIVRWQPARVLAECAAKRAIVEALDSDAPEHQWMSALTLEWVVKELAAVYADHPDYDEAWRL